jgi:acetyl-CoA C-acetyltransferase
MSGARIVQSVLSAFKNKGGKYGVVGICNGGGGSTSMVI